MDQIVLWLGEKVPWYVWQILLFFAPANPILRFIFDKIGYVPKNQ